MKRNYYFLFFSNFFDFLIICWLCLFCICCCFWQKFTSFLPCLFHCYVELCMWGGLQCICTRAILYNAYKDKIEILFSRFRPPKFFRPLDGFCLIYSRFSLHFSRFQFHSNTHPNTLNSTTCILSN